jgi:mannose PTS system EIIC component
MELTIVALKLSLAGSLLFLDRTHLFQFMISRPLVTAPVVGFLAGNPFMALLMGAIIELLWIHRIPLGTDITPDDTTLAVLVASVGALNLQVEHGIQFAPWIFGFLIFLPAAYINPKIELALRKFNNRLWHGAWEAILKGSLKGVARFHWTGALMAFIISFIVIFAWLFVGLHVIKFFFPLIPPFIKSALNITAWFIPAVGVASALNTAPNFWTVILFSLSFLLLTFLS